MLIDRRAFVAGTTLAAVTPALPAFLLDFAAPVPDVSRPCLVIQGWSTDDRDSPDDKVWLRVDHGWRTAWR